MEESLQTRDEKHSKAINVSYKMLTGKQFAPLEPVLCTYVKYKPRMSNTACRKTTGNSIPAEQIV